jgi:ribosomal protein RSM22 (predicted rRNA methylase)
VQFLLAAESTKFISVISFGKEFYKRRERSERPDRFVSNGKYRIRSVRLSQRSLANRKVFRIGLHATASKSSPRKALFSSVQEQIQHQLKGNFLEEHITYQVCLKLMKLK